jgi:hypothetical protein
MVVYYFFEKIPMISKWKEACHSVNGYMKVIAYYQSCPALHNKPYILYLSIQDIHFIVLFSLQTLHTLVKIL